MIAPAIAPGTCAANTLHHAFSSSLADGLLDVHRSTGSKSSAFALAETLGAITALQHICQDAATAAVSACGSYQAQAPTQEILQVLCEQSITVAGRKAVAVAISAVPGALHRLMVLMHVSHDTLFTTGPLSLAIFRDPDQHSSNCAAKSSHAALSSLFGCLLCETRQSVLYTYCRVLWESQLTCAMCKALKLLDFHTSCVITCRSRSKRRVQSQSSLSPCSA